MQAPRYPYADTYAGHLNGMDRPVEINTILSEGRRHLLTVILRDGPECVYCGRNVAGTDQTTLDHVRAKAHRGGRGTPNMVLACEPCNTARGHQPIGVWIAACRRRGLSVREDVLRRAIERSRLQRPWSKWALRGLEEIGYV